MSKTTLLASAALALALAAASPASAETNVMVIFDASGSMKRDAGGETRIAAAKRAVGDALSAMPRSARLGLMAYGHRRTRDCSDVELVAPIASEDAPALARYVGALDARGETPIADALRRAGRSFAAFKGQRNEIVLVTDGIEECGGDPCAAADELAGMGVDLKVNVVGFTLDERQRQLLQCVTDKTGGRYFDARDTRGLQSALREVQAVVAQAPAPASPPPAPPHPKVVFADDFDGTALGEHWQVANEKPDGYVVENGELLASVTGEGGFRKGMTPNRFQLSQPLPAGDWDMVLDTKPTFATGRDSAWLGVYQDEKNFVAAHLSSSMGHCSELVLSIVKRTNGEESLFNKRVAGSPTCGYGKEDVPAVVKKLGENGAKLVLSKRGRRYTASIELKAGVLSDKPVTMTTDEVSVVRLTGAPAFAVGQFEARKGETLMSVDRFAILSVPPDGAR
jgi:Ca-activated chloride channel homolog